MLTLFYINSFFWITLLFNFSLYCWIHFHYLLIYILNISIHYHFSYKRGTIMIKRSLQILHRRHCIFLFVWSKDELIRDVLLWTPTYGRAKAGRPARTYIQQLCEDTECSPEDLPEAMNDREKWRKRVRDICACGTTWLLFLLLFILHFSHQR